MPELQDVLLDSRRLTGASMLLPRPGAMLETRLPSDRKRRLMRRWQELLQALYADLGWSGEWIVVRDQGPTQMLAATAPMDALLAATYVLEHALVFALLDPQRPGAEAWSAAVDALDARIVRRTDPRLAALARAAQRHGAQMLVGERDVSLGMGAAARRWPDDELPLPDEVNWELARQRLPIALITGTNGKTTTARLLARMLSLAGHTVGFSCTDYVQIGAQILERDDYSGPTGARMVLQHPDITAAVLETARGGLLRRGIQVRHADVGIVTNVAADHLGDGGIHTLEQLAEAKFSLTRGLHPQAPLVVNAEDRYCTRHARKLARPVYWFALHRPPRALLRGQCEVRAQVYASHGEVVIDDAAGIRPLLPVADIPITVGGNATHNLANALAATAAGLAMGVAEPVLAQALRDFGRDWRDNPGRANLFWIRGAQVLADYGHNPEGLAAVFRIARALPHGRCLVSFGQAGDRSDADIRELADQVAALNPDRILVKDMPDMLRGRAAGEIPALLRTRLLDCGIAEQRIEILQGDPAALQSALAWIQPGDLAVLFIHTDSAALLEQLDRLQSA